MPTSAVAPGSPVEIALYFQIVGIKSISERVRAADNAHSFSRRSATRLYTLLHLDVAQAQREEFMSEIGSVYFLRCRKSATINAPWSLTDDCNLTRPKSIITMQVRTNSSQRSIGDRSGKSIFSSATSAKIGRTSRSFSQGLRNPTTASEAIPVSQTSESPREFDHVARYRKRQKPSQSGANY